MIKLTITTIRAKKARFFLSALAVALGVAFMAGTLVLTDTISRAYESVTGDAYQGTDALVRSNRVVDDPNTGPVRGTIDESVLTMVRSVPGVASAEAQIEGIAQIVGSDGELLDDSVNRAVPLALAWQDDAELSPMEIVEGRAPTAADEIVVDRSTADTASFTTGDAVRVVTPVGSELYTISGIATYGGADDAAGAPVIAFTPDEASTVLAAPGQYDAVQVTADAEVSQAELVANLRATLDDPTLETLTGTEAAAEAQADSEAGLGFMKTFLMAFAIVSLLVGSFVISNTFSITVAQRTRESALLRAIGASRRQVMRSVMLESFLTGIVASAIGAAAGIATAMGLKALLGSFGIDLPAGDLVVAPPTIVISMLVGTVVTVVAAYLPARRAAKVAPIAAMRDVAIEHSGRSTRRTVIGTAISAVGMLLMAAGLGGAGVPAVGLGAIVIFFGVAALGPVVARPVSRILGAPLPVLRGMTGTIARENATRNPKRTSATASALMIGVGLVVFITVFGASARASISQSVEDAMLGDWIVDTTWGQGGISPEVAAMIDELPETGAVTSLRYAPLQVEGSTTSASAVTTATASSLIDFDLQAGSIGALGAEELGVQADVAEAEGWSIGDEVEVTFAETGTRTFTVGAVYGTFEPMGDYTMSIEAFDANVADAVDSLLVVGNADGVSMDAARAAIDRTLADFPTAQLRSEEEFKDTMASEINQMLNMIYALLALAVIIALFGIANTLALSVHERTRELGLLRAVGMGRSQVRSAVRWESVIIALLGTTLGLGIGMGFAWAIVQALESQGFNQLAVPTDQLTAIVLFGALAGVAAAILPARRAAEVDVLTALSSN